MHMSNVPHVRACHAAAWEQTTTNAVGGSAAATSGEVGLEAAAIRAVEKVLASPGRIQGLAPVWVDPGTGASFLPPCPHSYFT